MSASGKSSNRHYEYHRGRSGGGHGIYALQGQRDRQRELLRQKRAREEAKEAEKARQR